jgi:hypothetical protein
MPVVFSDEVWGMHVCRTHPFVVAVGEALPLDQILELLHPPRPSMIEDLLYLLLFLPINNIRWQLGVVRPMCWGLVVWR